MGEKKKKIVTFRKKSDWQGKECLFCNNIATIEAVCGEGNVIALVRCCENSECKEKAEETALKQESVMRVFKK